MKIFLTALILLCFLNSPIEAQVPPPKDPLTKALIENAYNGELAKVQVNVKKGANVNAVDENKRTALMWAAFKGHFEVVEYLHEQGANINARDSDYQTALMYAANGSYLQIIEFLLKNGAEVNVQSKKRGFTALMTAASKGDVEVVQLLLDHGANADLTDAVGKTAAIFAEQYNQYAVVKLLANTKPPGDKP